MKALGLRNHDAEKDIDMFAILSDQKVIYSVFIIFLYCNENETPEKSYLQQTGSPSLTWQMRYCPVV